MKCRFTDEQIIGILKEHEEGVTAKELRGTHGMSDARFYKHKVKFSGMAVSDAKKLRACGLPWSSTRSLSAAAGQP